MGVFAPFWGVVGDKYGRRNVRFFFFFFFFFFFYQNISYIHVLFSAVLIRTLSIYMYHLVFLEDLVCCVAAKLTSSQYLNILEISLIYAYTKSC